MNKPMFPMHLEEINVSQLRSVVFKMPKREVANLDITIFAEYAYDTQGKRYVIGAWAEKHGDAIRYMICLESFPAERELKDPSQQIVSCLNESEDFETRLDMLVSMMLGRCSCDAEHDEE